jgi:hypothetical protein
MNIILTRKDHIHVQQKQQINNYLGYFKQKRYKIIFTFFRRLIDFKIQGKFTKNKGKGLSRKNQKKIKKRYFLNLMKKSQKRRSKVN